MRAVAALIALVVTSAFATELKLATFDGAAATTASWQDLNDPVMGGASTSTFKITADKTGMFSGTCAIVGFLKAPGFAKIVGSTKAKFGDITGFDNIAMRVKSTTPDYKGFKVAFAAPGIPKTSIFGGASYKAGFNLTSSSDWQVVEVPLTQFSYDWSGYTGRCDTKDPAGFMHKGVQHYCCSKSGLEPSKPEVCVDQKFLNIINSLEVWAEGVKGDFNIEIDWIGATKKSSAETIMMDAPQSIDVATFDGKAPHKWHSENDPVMGGKSSSSVEVTQGFADYKGTTRIVPALKAPGFTIAMTEGFPFLSKFPDVSSMDGLSIGVRNIGNFSGYKIAFCDSHINFYRCQVQSFKADLVIPPSADAGFQDVFVPWSKFSDKWNAATGKHTAENPPSAASLKAITQLQIWTEAVQGDFHLQLQYIRASKVPAVTLVI